MNEYFYLDKNNQQQGPISPTHFSAHNIKANTLVWCNGMTDWAPAGSVDDLREYFQSTHTGATPPPSPFAQQATHHQFSHNTTQQNPLPPCPDNNLVWAILCTILCCLPLGVVAIVYACKVNDRYAMGDFNGAIDASQKAKKWSLYGLIASVAFAILYFIFIFFAIGTTATVFSDL